MSSSHHVIHLPCQLVTMSFIQDVINLPCHPVTLPSIHPAINSHLPCHPFTMPSSKDHGHPFTMSSIHRLSQSPGLISSYHPQVTRPEELNQKKVLVMLETTLVMARQHTGADPPLPFFLPLPLLLANNNLPYSWRSKLF